MTAASETVVEPRQWLRGDGVLAAAMVMVAVQLVWKFDLVRRTYFRQDDFTFIARGLENDLTWDYLMRADYGHLMPGPFGAHWAMGRLGVYNDVLMHVVTIVLMGAAALALLRLLFLLYGSRPAILLPFAFYLLTPMTISSLSWWAVVIETLPFQVALPMALGAHILYVRTRRFRHALAAAGWTVFAMVFFVKAPFIPVLAFVLTAGWLGGIRKWQWPAWALYAAIVAGYAAILFPAVFTSVQLTNDTVQPSLPPLAVAAAFAWRLFSGSLVASALGGPWRWHPIGDDYAIAATPDAAVWAGLGAAALVVALTIRFRRRAWLAWLMLLGYFLLADVIPVMIGRIEQLGPDLGGFELRYIAPTASLTAVVVALAFIPREGERPLRIVWIPLAAVFAAGSIWSITQYTRLPLGENVKSYIETGRIALRRAPAGLVVLDTHVPAKVVYPIFFYDYALASKVLGPIAGRPVTWVRQLDGPLRNLMTFDERGRLRPVNIEGLTVPAGTACRPIGPAPERFRLPLPLPQGAWTVQVSYLNPRPARLTVGLGTGSADAETGKDLGWTYATVKGGGQELTIRSPDGARPCVGEIRVGVPMPAKTGSPIPLQPVTP
ncbi:hypothetical protein ACFWY5_07815 [Nonomuraea sp. NPDC059007]|uniref:hypothetical protein n=1 Tax=Nonomuraea sp. NPDC059007 TaxID=3346692 RepID=UPI00368BAAF1